MRFLQVLASLPVAALAAPADLNTEAVEAASGILVADLPAGVAAPKPAKIGEPVMRKDAKRQWFTLQKSFTIPGNKNGAKPSEEGHSHGASGGGGGLKGLGGLGSMGGMGSEGLNAMANFGASTFCGTCTVLAGQISIIDAQGKILTAADGIYVHHILTSRNGATKPFIQGPITMKIPGDGFVGAGDDNGNTPWVYTPRDGSIDSGFQMDATKTTFMANVNLVNYNREAKTVYVTYDLEYKPGAFGKSVKSDLISASGALNPGVSRAGAKNTTSTPMKVNESGSIILAKGHLHDGGSAMYLELKRGGQTYYSCSSVATYGGHIQGSSSPTISDVTDCNKGEVKIRAGDTVVMTSEYDIKAHPLRKTAAGAEASTMGMFRIIFAPGA